MNGMNVKTKDGDVLDVDARKITDGWLLFYRETHTGHDKQDHQLDNTKNHKT